MLVTEFDAYCLADRYADFLGTLTWYRMYCQCRPIGSKSEYQQALESLKAAFEEFDLDQISKWVQQPALDLFAEIEALLRRKRITEGTVHQIGQVLWEFESEKEPKFRQAILGEQIAVDQRFLYSRTLYEAVHPAFQADAYDDVLVSAFKYLDHHLQMILQLSPHDCYGEELINRAFSPSSGALQMNTSPNEQAGLRNLVSGANALFRNAAAHRAILTRDSIVFGGHHPGMEGYDIAATVVAMVGVLAHMATGLLAQRIDPQVRQCLSQATKKNGWDASVARLGLTWASGPLSDKERRIANYRLRVSLRVGAEGVQLLVAAHESVGPGVTRSLGQDLQSATGLGVAQSEG